MRFLGELFANNLSAIIPNRSFLVSRNFVIAFACNLDGWHETPFQMPFMQNHSTNGNPSYWWLDNIDNEFHGIGMVGRTIDSCRISWRHFENVQMHPLLHACATHGKWLQHQTNRDVLKLSKKKLQSCIIGMDGWLTERPVGERNSTL